MSTAVPTPPGWRGCLLPLSNFGWWIAGLRDALLSLCHEAIHLPNSIAANAWGFPPLEQPEEKTELKQLDQKASRNSWSLALGRAQRMGRSKKVHLPASASSHLAASLEQQTVPEGRLGSVQETLTVL